MTPLETNGLTKSFGDLVAVDDLDLTVESGEVFGFLGPNGAGKSTTINMLLGFLRPSAGSATVMGTDVTSHPVAAKEQVGVLPEGFSPYDRLTGREHVEYAGGLRECSPDVEALLERVGLDAEAWDRRAGTYSKGMCQRLALATALVDDPDLLILDEPSSGLDPEGMQEMRDLIRAEADAGTTVFFSSHLLSEVEAVCDRLGILVDGRLEVVGPLDELRDSSARAPLELTVEATPSGIESELASMEGVLSASVVDHTIAVELADPSHKIDVITRVHERAHVEDVVAETPSLEAMFERYVARGRAAGNPDGARPGSQDDTRVAEVDQ